MIREERGDLMRVVVVEEAVQHAGVLLDVMVNAERLHVFRPCVACYSSFVLPYRAVAVWLADRPHELAVPARWPLRLSCQLMLDAHVFVEDSAHVLHHYGLGTCATAGTVCIVQLRENRGRG